MKAIMQTDRIECLSHESDSEVKGTQQDEERRDQPSFPSPPARVWLPGCGSGLSGEALSEAGHLWVGLDISPAMLGEWADGRGDEGLCL